VARHLAPAETQDLLVPALVDGRARLAQRGVNADGLDRKPVGEMPVEVLARDEAAQARMEWRNVVVLKVDLDERLPVVGALVHLDVVQQVPVELSSEARPTPARSAATSRGPSNSSPRQSDSGVLPRFRQGLLVEMRRAQQRALQVVGPAMQGADDGIGIATPIEHDGLAVPADIGEQLDALRAMGEDPALAFGGQRMEIARCGTIRRWPT
jgi:hypothetical protein